jgi:HK97 family phage portal protein
MAKKNRKRVDREERRAEKRALKAARKAAEPRYPDVDRLPYTGITLAGVHINADNAVQLATVWACLRYLSQTIAMLPWNVMRSGDGKGAEIQSSNPVQWLIHNRPNPEWSSFQFRETLVHWALRHGNGYAEIERDRAGRPYALWPLHPDRVDPLRDATDGRLYFQVDNGGAKVDIDAADMFHLRGYGEGPIGVDVMTYASQSLGWAKAMQLFGASFFGNGANLGGVVTSKGKMDPGVLLRVKTEFDKLYKGARRANKTAFLDNGMEWKSTAVEPLKAQMIDANYFLIEEICRWFGVPPHKVAHLLRATFSNIEHQSIEVVQDSILPWVRRLEDEADFKLFGQNRQGLYTKIELRGLLRGDFKSQQEGFEVMRRNGIVNGDEWRELSDMSPMPAGAGGDKYIVQSQYVPLDRVGEKLEPASQPVPPSESAAQDEVDLMAEEEADAAV